MDPKIKRQYESAYGEFVSGDYAIGELVVTRYVAGEVIWSYRHAVQGLTYVVDNSSGFPVEVETSQVYGKVTP
jgi:hypothetical protein